MDETSNDEKEKVKIEHSSTSEDNIIESDSKEEKKITDPVRHLEESSIHNFDEDYWLKKAKILKILIEDEKKRKEFLGDEKKIGFLMFELFSTKIHCCETLLRLLVLTKKGYFLPLIPLIKLDFKKFNKELEEMQKDYDKYFDDQDKFFTNNFYPFPDLKEDKEKICTSIKFLKKSLPLIISEYVNRGAYNVFKHGFYGATSQDNVLKIGKPAVVEKPTVVEKPALVGKAPNMITWYEIDKFEDHYRFNQKSKAISSEREFNIILICSSILAQLFSTKRAKLKKSKQVQIKLFKEVDLDKVFSIYNYNTSLDNMIFSYEITLPENFP